MIEFVTLFLGLVSGARQVEVAVDERVAAVVLRLDGHQVRRLDEPPWKAIVDFGDLEPHRLEAVAFDAAGRQLERAHRLINYTRSDYQAVIVLDSAPRGAERLGKVVWEAVLDRDRCV